MARYNRRRSGISSIYSFAITWLIMSAMFPMYRLWGLLFSLGVCSFVAYMAGKASASKEAEAQKTSEAKKPQQQQTVKPAAAKKSYGPEVDPIIEEGNKALSEMGRLYMSVLELLCCMLVLRYS